MSGDRAGGDGCGCLTLIVLVLLLWALVFGVSYDGKTHTLRCSTERGVEIK